MDGAGSPANDSISAKSGSFAPKDGDIFPSDASTTSEQPVAENKGCTTPESEASLTYELLPPLPDQNEDPVPSQLKTPSKRRHRPCKGQRQRLNKLLEKLTSQVAIGADISDLKLSNLPPSMQFPHRRAMLKRRVDQMLHKHGVATRSSYVATADCKLSSLPCKELHQVLAPPMPCPMAEKHLPFKMENWVAFQQFASISQADFNSDIADMEIPFPSAQSFSQPLPRCDLDFLKTLPPVSRGLCVDTRPTDNVQYGEVASKRRSQPISL
jgi:hypothetical protein